MYNKTSEKIHICQGDLFQKFDYVRWAFLDSETEEIKIDQITIPFFVVLTQACDLQQDYKDRNENNGGKQDKVIDSVLVCPAYIAELVKQGKHLEKLRITREQYNSERWNVIKRNNNARYHFLKEDKKLKIPELVVDFKQYYTIPTKVMYEILKKHYIGSMKELFLSLKRNEIVGTERTFLRDLPTILVVLVYLK